MAKDTEKLIRQLSLISYLMAERRPVTALEIRLTAECAVDFPDDPDGFVAARPTAYGDTIWTIGPTPEPAIRQLAPMVEAGVDHFMIGATTLSTLERFGMEVAPELAARG